MANVNARVLENQGPFLTPHKVALVCNDFWSASFKETHVVKAMRVTKIL
jgi:hypothetical protein